jgi:multidrug resistance efflux pump
MRLPQSQIDLAKISYDNAMKALNEAKVYAPVSGVVSAKNVSVSDMVSPGAPAYVIDQEGAAPMVSFNLSEDGANALSVGSPVTVVYNGQEFSAHHRAGQYRQPPDRPLRRQGPNR